MGDIPDNPYQTYGHLTAAELVYGIRDDPTIFDDIIDDYNTWYDYWYGDGSSGYDYPDQNLYKEAEREVDGLRRFSGSGSAIAVTTTFEYIHDLHKERTDERYLRWTVGASTSLPPGGQASVGLIKEDNIDKYKETGYVAVGGGYYAGVNAFINDRNEYYGQEAFITIRSSAGVVFNTPNDYLIGEYYNGQFRSDIPFIEYLVNTFLCYWR
ncbi:MAG TPA: hypothetical protein PLU96_07855 [Methanofastidiosum sp.]|mgnify:FL=1|nr:hypothetical protein [Methanofastidiosum sp.]HQG61974.1 hypothetical protein [Methanofastidiosum sp.]